MAFGVEGDVPYLVHALLPGAPADELLRAHGPQPLAELILPLTHAAAAIDFAAAAGVDHGVLGLSDWILAADHSGLSGFGIVQALAAADIPVSFAVANDVTGLARITLELAVGRVCDRADVHDALERSQVVDAAAVARVFAAALADEPDRRPRTALEFASALQQAIVASTSAAPATLPLPVPAPSTDPFDLPIRLPGACAPIESPELPAFRGESMPLGSLGGNAPRTPALPTRWLVAVAAVVVAIVIGFAGGFSVAKKETPPAAPARTTDAAPTTGQTFSENVIEQVPVPEGSTQRPPVSPSRTQAPPEATPTTAIPPAPARPVAQQPPIPQAAREPAPRVIEAPVTTGRVLVHANQPASVHVDGRPYGETPIAIRDLTFGIHSVEVTAPGYVTWRRSIMLSAASPAQSLDVTLQTPAESIGDAGAVGLVGSSPGALQIDSRPSGAQVYVDGRLIGRTPLSMSGVEAGTHGVRIEAPGYRAWSTSVAVTSGSRARVAASLEQ